MTVRAIKRINTGLQGAKAGQLAVVVPKAIIHGIYLELGDVFICEFTKHFDEEHNLIREINESVEVRCQHAWFGVTSVYKANYLDIPHIIVLTDLSVTKKYGFLVNEYLEIVFKEIKRGKESIPIFPERIVEELDFVPEKS